METTTELKAIVKGIISQREAIMRKGHSQKNNSRCAAYITELKTYIEAYQNQWNQDGWRRFVVNNTEKIIYLIPENQSGLTVKQKLFQAL
jgi:hypothetical protein